MSLKFPLRFGYPILAQLKHGLQTLTHIAKTSVENRLLKMSTTMQTLGVVDALRTPGGLAPIVLSLVIAGIYPHFKKLRVGCRFCESR